MNSKFTQGNPSWNPPCFMDSKCMGVGLWSGVAEKKYSIIYFGVCMYMYDT